MADLSELFARAIAAGESVGCDPDALFPWAGHAEAKPRWMWHLPSAKKVIAGIALANLPVSFRDAFESLENVTEAEQPAPASIPTDLIDRIESALAKTETRIMAAIDDLKAVTAALVTEVSTFVADTGTALDNLKAALDAAGSTNDPQISVAVTTLQGLVDKMKASDPLNQAVAVTEPAPAPAPAPATPATAAAAPAPDASAAAPAAAAPAPTPDASAAPAATPTT